MEKQTKYDFSPTQMALLEQLQNLFSRHNLCSNNYLYQHIDQQFRVPIAIIADERRVAQITNSMKSLQQALELCNFIKVIDAKTVQIVDFPTVKFEAKDKKRVQQIVNGLKEAKKKVLVFESREQNRIHVSLLQQMSNQQFFALMKTINKDSSFIPFQFADLTDDLKAGISRVRKIKERNRKTNNRSQKYSLDRPPAVFIRKAVESSSDEEDSNVTEKKQIERDKKYRAKPIINEEEFPALS